MSPTLTDKLNRTRTLVVLPILVSLTLNLSRDKSLSSVMAQSSSSVNEDDRRHCDSDFCDPIVSKCYLTYRCQCDFATDAKCAKDCVDCLEEEFGKCCGCVGLCPNSRSGLHASHVGEINKTDNQLFAILTETDDLNGRWHVKTLDRGVEIIDRELGMLEYAYRWDKQNKKYINSPHDHLEKQNCTVAFIARRLSMTGCRKYCISLGASKFRWFHDSCCECIGPYCLQYGIHEPGCRFDSEYY